MIPQAVSRRQYLSQGGLALLGLALNGSASGEDRPRNILLRSSWQTVNIGDIAHTPGVLALLERHLPGVEVTLWPSRIDNGVEEILRARFPGLKIARHGSPELERAFETCDFLLHGSGPSLVAQRDVVSWHEATGKPYGIYGITVAPKGSASTREEPDEAIRETMEVMSGARFVFFRDSRSLAFAREQGCRAPIMEFGPDGAFACDLRDDARAEAFLGSHGLEPGQFLCCIPRLRYTPYWRIKDLPFDPVKDARNEAMKEHDHAPHREAILRIVRETDLKVLVCPEDRTQMEVGREMIMDRLPAEVRERVVWRPDYWLTGEALSTYVRSAGLFGNEMHSPIMSIGHGVPAVVCRWAEQTWKGWMWQDIGLGDWLFDFDDPDDVARLPETVFAMATAPEEARARALEAQRFVQQRQAETMAILAREL